METVKFTIDRPVRFAGAGEFVSEVPWKHMERTIGNYELIIGVQDTVYLQEENRRYEVHAGDVLLLLPGRRHGGYRESKPGVKFYWFHFTVPEEAVWHTETDMQQELAVIFARPERPWSVREVYLPQWLRPENRDRLQILVQQILHVANASYFTNQSVDYLLTSLLIEVSEAALARSYSRMSKSHGEFSFTKIAEWTRIHADEPLTVAQIAQKFNYNKDYLTRLFKQHTSVGPMEFIHMVRINRAKELLSRTSMTVKEIAAEVGFVDDKYFMRLFKRYVTMSPTVYRNAYHQTFMNNY